jgi:sorbose reductase
MLFCDFMVTTTHSWMKKLRGVFYTVQHCAAQMKAQKSGGSIVCIASTAGHKSLFPQTITAYTASKFGVRGFTQQVAAELAQYNIRVNSISPGYVSDTATRLVSDACIAA